MSRLAAPLAAAFDAVDPGWRPLVDAWRRSAAGRSLIVAIDGRLATGAVVYPARPLRALELTPRQEVKVVIVGQDPYHGPGQAEGLAFSVPAGVPLPPSLRNILGEQARDLGVPMAPSWSLVPWARRGVMLLNAVLTVEDGRPSSHARLGWQALTDDVVTLAEDSRPKVFVLWGAQAQCKGASIEAVAQAHLVLRCNHPSPLSAGRGAAPFVGCGHFGLANRFLAGRGVEPTDWSLA